MCHEEALVELGVFKAVGQFATTQSPSMKKARF